MVFLLGIEKAPKECLVDLLTVLDGPGVIDYLTDQASQLASKLPIIGDKVPPDHLQNQIKEYGEKLGSESIEELRDRLIQWLENASGVSRRERGNTEELSRNCLTKCAAVFGIKGEVHDYDQLERVLVGRYLRRIGDNLEEMMLQSSPDKLSQFSDKLDEELQKYRQADKDHLYQQLQLQKNSEKTVLQVVRDSLIAGTGISLIQSLGFSAFIGLSNTIFFVGGLMGLTVPFAVYISATSLLSFMLGPVGIGMVILGLGGNRLLNVRSSLTNERLIMAVVVLHSVVVESTKEEQVSFWSRVKSFFQKHLS